MPYIDKEKFRMHIIRYQNNPLKVILTDKEKGKFTRMLDEVPTADVVERKKGKWTEKQVIHADEAKEVVEEWQSCRCSICGHYNTRPYMYFFTEPNYCSFCGADMREETEDAQLD